MKMLKLVIDYAVILIGIAMVILYAGKALPPLLSGIAFLLIGISHLITK